MIIRFLTCQNIKITRADRAPGNALPLTGRTCPWNTFAIWRVQELGLIGFPLIGDGTADNRASGGVEVRLRERLFVVISCVLLVIFHSLYVLYNILCLLQTF